MVGHLLRFRGGLDLISYVWVRFRAAWFLIPRRLLFQVPVLLRLVSLRHQVLGVAYFGFGTWTWTLSLCCWLVPNFSARGSELPRTWSAERGPLFRRRVFRIRVRRVSTVFKKRVVGIEKHSGDRLEHAT